MNLDSPHFVSLMQTNYKTVKVTFLDAYGRGAVPAAAPQVAPAARGAPTAPPAWAEDGRLPWARDPQNEPRRGYDERGNKLYSYKVLKEQEIKAGDVVVVLSNGSSLPAFAVVHTVDELPDLDFSLPTPYDWIVQVVDFGAYHAQKDTEDKFRIKLHEVERLRKQQETLKAMSLDFEQGSEAAKAFQAAIGLFGATFSGSK